MKHLLRKLLLKLRLKIPLKRQQKRLQLPKKLLLLKRLHQLRPNNQPPKPNKQRPLQHRKNNNK